MARNVMHMHDLYNFQVFHVYGCMWSLCRVLRLFIQQLAKALLKWTLITLTSLKELMPFTGFLSPSGLSLIDSLLVCCSNESFDCRNRFCPG